MPLDAPTIASLLAAQGYDVPVEDLAEIQTTVQRLLEQAVAWDALDLADEEPWATWPGAGLDG